MTDREQELQDKINKMRRRAKRNARASWAEGYMDGLCSVLNENHLVIDCGANMGNVSQRFVDTGAHVIAFEPDPFCVENLKKRFKGVKNFELFEKGVGAKKGKFTLQRSENFADREETQSVKSTIVEGGRGVSYDGDMSVEVEVIDFVAFLGELIKERKHIDFVKMDIEGAELEILESMLGSPVFDGITAMMVETHENKFRDLRPRFRALREKAADLYPISKLNLDWI